MAVYRCKGIHTRYQGGGLQIFKVGDPIIPTVFELEQFPDKFRVVDEPEVEEAMAEIDEVEEAADIDGKLEEAKAKLQEVISSDEWEDSVIAEAKKLMNKNPQKQETKDSLLEAIGEFLADLNEVEE